MLAGRVVRASSPKTKTVLVIRRIRHSRYRKLMKRKKKFLAHDISGNHKLGQLVFIKACAPYSKRKRWVIYEHHSDSDASGG
ncbi:30S ribosomal protein S17 [Candidatus Hodgkinia cicadicola]|nr:30S ribosomal protein S17 [Candidatus Hodgkinia cicadicola]